MLKDSQAFSSFSAKNLDKAKEFYGGTLGLEVKLDEMGLMIQLASGSKVFVYQKDDHARLPLLF